MGADRLDRIRELFDEGRQLVGAERDAWLERLSPQDESLRTELASLLEEYDGGSSSLGASVDPGLVQEWLADLAPTDESGRTASAAPFEIPGFRIVARLGEGAQGAVYEAEQERPRRTVALKVLRPHLADSSLRRRFEREAEALAQLHHPGIAVVHESGAVETELGVLPYFAMERVDGSTLTEHAKTAALDTQGRVRLLADLCDAVAHAHEKGIVHRDLKPSNILVDREGRPRVLDFGVARIVGQDLETSTLRTQTGQVIGTLAYMSPEQAAGLPDDVDARSDVFALGVIAFELLTRRLPRDLAGRPFPEQVQLLAEGETKTLGSVDRALRGDLETIVAKAMASEKERRYSNAAALGDDLRRFLKSEPIAARPTTSLYQLRRFVRRNPRVAIGACLFAVVLAAAALYENQRRRQAEHVAYRAALSSAFRAFHVREYTEAERGLMDAPPGLRGWEWEYLRSQFDQAERSLELDCGEIAYANLMPDSDRLFVLEIEGRASHVDLESGEQTVLPAAEGTLACVADVEAGLFGTFERHDNTVSLYAMEDGEQIATLETLAHVKYMGGEVLAEGRYISVYTYDGWELHAIDSENRILSGERDGSVEYLSQDESWLLFRDGAEAAVREPGRPDEAKISVSRPDKERSLIDAVVLPDESAFAVAAGGNLALYDAETGAQRWSRSAHDDEIRQVEFAPMREALVSSGLDDAIRLWNSDTGERLAELPFPSDQRPGIAISADGRTLVASPRGPHAAFEYRRGGDRRRVSFWDMGIAEDPCSLYGYDAVMRTVTFSPDGSWIVTGSTDEPLRIWDAVTGEELFAGDEGDVDRIEWDEARGRVLFDGERGIRVVDATTWSLIGTIEEHAYAAGFALSPDGKTIVVSDSGALQTSFIDVETGERHAEFRTEYAVRGIVFTPDGRRCLTTAFSSDGFLAEPIRAWNTADWSYEELDMRGWRICISPDGARIVVTQARGAVVLDAESFEELHRLEAHRGQVYSLAYSPDGRRFAMGGSDGVVRIWETDNWTEVGQLRGHGVGWRSLAFSPDGKTLASAGRNGARLWSTLPVHDRVRAREAARARREDAEAWVRELLDGGLSRSAVLDRLDERADLESVFRSEVRRAVLRSPDADQAETGDGDTIGGG